MPAKKTSAKAESEPAKVAKAAKAPARAEKITEAPVEPPAAAEPEPAVAGISTSWTFSASRCGSEKTQLFRWVLS